MSVLIKKGYNTTPYNYLAYKIARENNPKSRSFILPPYDIRFNLLIPELKKYGIYGFEYSGGSRLSGSYHRAFSIFDEEFVNDHKILCIS